MAQPNFDYEGAKSAGYTDQEIQEFLASQPVAKPTNQPKASKFFENIYNNIHNMFYGPGPIQKEETEASKIDTRLLKKVPNFDAKSALDSGYTSDEINEFLKEQIPKRTALEKGGRLGAQFGIGALQATPSGMAYETAVAPLASEEAQLGEYRQKLFEDIETLQQAKELGGFPGRDEPWNEQDENQLQNLIQ